ncbi:unnamed protein product [Protopolystoma xenopodis]|uniref:Uncharacterized protein n=1 Tax=Protopolystoma xenopodis TaxID=117903 RepID=A0A3S5B1B8_9PLAT|nr:unnamed protein product [Protopolystoma xenopodis]
MARDDTHRGAHARSTYASAHATDSGEMEAAGEFEWIGRSSYGERGQRRAAGISGRQPIDPTGRAVEQSGSRAVGRRARREASRSIACSNHSTAEPHLSAGFRRRQLRLASPRLASSELCAFGAGRPGRG